MGQSVLVTVGSTCFPALSDFMVRDDTLRSLYEIGVMRLTVQYGTHESKVSPDIVSRGNMPHVTTYRYTDDLTKEMKSASIIVSHAGAGTILEAIDLGKSLIVVVNTALMDNHQTELARAMAACSCCTVVTQTQINQDLIPTIRKLSEHGSGRTIPLARPPVRVQGVFGSIIRQEASIAMAQRSRNSPPYSGPQDQ